MNKAAHFFLTGRALCDECGKPVEQVRIERARRLGPFLCQRCQDAVNAWFEAGLIAFASTSTGSEVK